ncbi:hypothetical protein DYB35_013986 [Aphanomyces astaci]|uniref:ERAP1-like C-terminal domain-containing protein n=1 Tax=Aphanomyces astaci TaxID=112090 RepID=A0A418CT96_APHAT|nr:hypothetical protein DYB35_013986 [Aphanomyces astaci]
MDQELTSNFRRDVIAMLAAANDMAVAAQASARFHTAVAAPASLSADLRSIVYSIHVRTTSEPDAAFEHPPPVFETSVFIEEKLHVLGALGRFPSVELKTRALEWAAVAADGSTVTWEYVQAKWDALSAQYSQIVVGCILCVSIANCQLEQAAAAVEAFLVGHPQGAFAPPLALFLENIRTVATMYARDVTPLAAWIQTL